MTIKPWKVLKTDRLYRNIRIDQCELPDGKVHAVTVLEFRDWVTILALTKDGQVVLERQYRHGAQKVVPELPGGSMESEDENPEQAARRELLEETGYTSERFIALGQVSPDPADHTNLMYPFLALDAERSHEQDLDDTEELEVLLLPLEDVISMAQRGELLQSLHVSTLFLALAHLGRIR